MGLKELLLARTCYMMYRLIKMLMWQQCVKIVEITVCSGLKNRAGHHGQPSLPSLRRDSDLWLRPAWAILIVSNAFEIYTLQTADIQPRPALDCPWCCHTQGEVRRRESYLRIENVLLRNNRPPAAVSGPAQVTRHPPALMTHLSVSFCLSMWHWLFVFVALQRRW